LEVREGMRRAGLKLPVVWGEVLVSYSIIRITSTEIDIRSQSKEYGANPRENCAVGRKLTSTSCPV
jgi:hypothetical protein